LHQILPKAWRYPSENHSQDPTGFGDDAMSILRIKEWFNCFKDGRTFVDSEPRPGRPSTSRNDNVIDQVRTLVMQDCRITVRELAIEVGVSTESIHSNFVEDVGLKSVREVRAEAAIHGTEATPLEIARDMLDNANSDSNFLNTVITGDETWVYGYDPETKTQSSQWKHPSSPRPKKARQVRINVKVMLTVFFDSRGMVHHEYAPQGTTITKEYYQEVLHRLRDSVQCQRPDLWAATTWQLHHDNATVHFSHLIRTFLAKTALPWIVRLPTLPTKLRVIFGYPAS
jgi:hypothetical protein